MAFALPSVGFELGAAASILLVAVGWVCAIGLLWIWRNTIGLALLHLADALNIQIKAFGHVLFGFDFGGPIRDANTLVENFLSDWAIGADLMIGKTWHAMGLVFSVTAHEIAALAGDTLNLGHWIVHTAIPGAVGAAVGDLRGAVQIAKGAYSGVAGTLATFKRQFWSEVHGLGASVHWLRSTVGTIERDLLRLDREAKTLTRHAGHAVVTDAVVPGVAGLPIPIGRTIADLKRLARKHEGLFGASVMAGVMANVLGLSSWRCLTRGNIGRVSRALCGLSTNALNDLLGLLVDLLVLQNICEVITLMEKGFGLVEPELASWLGTATAQFVHCGYDLPAPLQLPALNYPAGAPAANPSAPTVLQLPTIYALNAG